MRKICYAVTSASLFFSFREEIYSVIDLKGKVFFFLFIDLQSILIDFHVGKVVSKDFFLK